MKKLDAQKQKAGFESIMYFVENFIEISKEVNEIEKYNENHFSRNLSEYTKVLIILEHCVLETTKYFMSVFSEDKLNQEQVMFFREMFDKVLLLFRSAKLNFKFANASVLQNIFREIFELNALFISVVKFEAYDKFLNSTFITEYKKRKELGYGIEDELKESLLKINVEIAENGNIISEDKYIFGEKVSWDSVSVKYDLLGREQYKVASIKFHSMSYGLQHKNNFLENCDVNLDYYGLEWIFWVIYKVEEFLKLINVASKTLSSNKCGSCSETEFDKGSKVLVALYEECYVEFKSHFEDEFKEFINTGV